ALHRVRLGGLAHGRRGQDPARRRDREGGGLDRPLTARVRLLALDIDGTLLGGDKRISPRTLAAVGAARASDVRVVLVTGRRYPAARPIAVQLGSGVPLVLHHGALAVEPHPRRITRVRPSSCAACPWTARWCARSCAWDASAVRIRSCTAASAGRAACSSQPSPRGTPSSAGTSTAAATPAYRSQTSRRSCRTIPSR